MTNFMYHAKNNLFHSLRKKKKNCVTRESRTVEWKYKILIKTQAYSVNYSLN